LRKKEGNKELDIIDASVRIFSKVGYFDTKIHKIADEAGVANGTVYLYFKNKEEILIRIFESVWQNLFLRIEQIDSEITDPVLKFHRMIDSVFDYFNQNASLATVFVNEQHHIMKQTNELLMNYYRKTLSICQKVLNEGVTHNVFKKEVDPVVFSLFFFGGIRYSLQQWAQDQEQMSLLVISENIKNLVLNGITNVK